MRATIASDSDEGQSRRAGKASTAARMHLGGLRTSCRRPSHERTASHRQSSPIRSHTFHKNTMTTPPMTTLQPIAIRLSVLMSVSI